MYRWCAERSTCPDGYISYPPLLRIANFYNILRVYYCLIAPFISFILRYMQLICITANCRSRKVKKSAFDRAIYSRYSFSLLHSRYTGYEHISACLPRDFPYLLSVHVIYLPSATLVYSRDISIHANVLFYYFCCHCFCLWYTYLWLLLHLLRGSLYFVYPTR